MKYSQKRLVIFCCITAMIWATSSLIIKSVEPVVSTDVALLQMENTTEGHVASRGYFGNVQPTLYSGVIPLGATILTGALMFGVPSKTQKEEK